MNGFAQDAAVQAQGHRERAVDCPGDEGSLVKPPHSTAHMERIQHYQEELRKRREADSRGKLDIDPNASLRLKKLSQNPKVGIDNPTFEGKEKTCIDTGSQDPVTGEWRARAQEVFQELQKGQRKRGGIKKERRGRLWGSTRKKENKRWEKNEGEEVLVTEGDSQIPLVCV